MTTRHDDVTEDLPKEYEVEGWRVASRSTGADMSTVEQRLREWMTHAGHAQMKNLDALLAEHRAEVEALRRNLADAQKDADENAEALSSASAALDVAGYPCGAATPAERIAEMVAAHNAEVERLTAERESWRILAEKSRARAEAARDAALEEGALVVDMMFGAACQFGAIAIANNAHETAKEIRALKSSPCAVLPVDKVREVLSDLRRYGHERELEAVSDGQVPLGGRMVAWAAENAAKRLGVDLDAKAERPSDAMGTQAGEDGETEAVPTAHPPGTCRVCGAIDGHPHKMSCRPSNREAAALVTPPWCEECGVAAFHPDCFRR
jgi:hypothetical protein